MRQIEYCELPSRRFGVEIEVSNNLSKQDLGNILVDFENFFCGTRSVKVTTGSEGWAQTKQNNYWHVKFDRTCGPKGKNFDHGWEIASYIASGLKDVVHIANLADYLNIKGAETNPNCGFHVHVEVKDHSSTDIGRLLARWLKIEHVLLSICHSSRVDNPYCIPLRSKFVENHEVYSSDDLQKFWDLMRPKDFGVHGNYDKRVTLNTVGFATHEISPLFTRCTVELRLPECRLDNQHVRHWTSFIVNLVESSKRSMSAPVDLSPSRDINDILMYAGLSGENDFSIFDPDLLSTKVWFLKKIIRNSNDFTLVDQALKHLEFVTLI